MKIKALLMSSAKHELISGSFFIFLGSTVSSFLAFVLNLYFVRNLSYSDYGIFAALISLILLLTIPAGSLLSSIVRYATNFFTKGEDERAGAFYVKLFKYLLILSVLILILFVICLPLISNFLKIESFSTILIAGITVSISYLVVLNTGFLQSKLYFGKIGLLNIFSGIAKLIIGILMVYLGFRALGALFGNLMFPLTFLVIGYLMLRKDIRKRAAKVNIPKKEFLSYALPTAFATIALSSFISTDVILVKHYFTPDEAGLYGGISLIGRVIFYFTGPISMVMFPLVVKRHTMGKNYNSLLYLSLILVLVAGLSITIFYYLFPEFIIKIFLGGKGYLELIPLVGLSGVFLTLYSLNSVMVGFFLSIKKTLVSVIIFIYALLQIGLIYVYHDTFMHIIYVSILSLSLLLASLVMYYLLVNKKEFIKT